MFEMTRGGRQTSGPPPTAALEHTETPIRIEPKWRTKVMPKRESTSKKSAPRRGTLASYRRENAHIQRMVLANLTPEQRMQLSTTRGNPHIEARVSRFITALDRADQVLHSLPKNRRNPRGLMTEKEYYEHENDNDQR